MTLICLKGIFVYLSSVNKKQDLWFDYRPVLLTRLHPPHPTHTPAAAATTTTAASRPFIELTLVCPKSAIFRTPPALSSRLEGLISRCSKPCTPAKRRKKKKKQQQPMRKPSRRPIGTYFEHKHPSCGVEPSCLPCTPPNVSRNPFVEPAEGHTKVLLVIHARC